MKNEYDIIDTVLVSDKNDYLMEEENKYVFKVSVDANKIEVRKAIEKLFDVKVVSVNIMNYAGKLKRAGRSPKMGRRANWKKAIVTLHEESSIDVY